MRRFFILCLFPAVSFSSSFPNDHPVSIPITIAITQDSLWTREEILVRFENTRRIFQKSCHIDLHLGQVMEITDEDLQDLENYSSSEGRLQLRAVLSRLGYPSPPILIYAREAKDEQDQQGKDPGPLAQAYMLGGQGNPGNLYWSRYEELHEFHGIAVLSEHYSVHHPNFASLRDLDRGSQGPYDIDAHEIGHLLLNDAGHNEIQGNIMSWAQIKPEFNRDQCLRMRNFLERENVLKKEIALEMLEIIQRNESCGCLTRNEEKELHAMKIAAEKILRNLDQQEAGHP